MTLLLALAALVAFYGLWLRPEPSFDPDANIARPTTAERRGNGYAAAYEWLQRSGVEARSLRDRYTVLKDLDAPSRGNLLVLALPAVEVFRSEELSALDHWVRRGNTLLINAALIDQPGWAARRAASAVVEIEALTAIEFETRKARETRLDDTPLSQRVREEDEREARRKADPDADDEREEEKEDEPGMKSSALLDVPEKIRLNATGPHVLLAGVKTLVLETDYDADEWSLRMPYDNFVLTLARTPAGEGAFYEQRVGEGRVLLSAGGSLFTNRALGQADNALLFANIVGTCVSHGGVVLFDDLRQGLSASYDPARFYEDARLYKTMFIVLGLWLVWVLGSTRLRAPAILEHDPSEAELVQHAGGLIARTVAPPRIAQRLFDLFFAGVARAARRSGAAAPEREDQWRWLERHGAILPQELDQLKAWYADAGESRKLPLTELQNLLDSLESRLKT